MDYYEEFGVRHTASQEEVRQAYKTVTRLLHPDGQPDEKVKRVAECQMKRANEIFALLLDPQRRRAYDMSLEHSPEQAGAPRGWQAESGDWKHLALRHWFWILLAVMIVGSSVWFVSAGSPPGSGAADSASDETAAQPQASAFAGSWSDAPRDASTDSGALPIAELRLAEKGGVLQGSYEMSETVSSPRVQLRVQGSWTGGSSATLTWQSNDGARGEMDVSLQTSNLMRASWWTTRFAPGRGASSGVSMLFRQPER